VSRSAIYEEPKLINRFVQSDIIVTALLFVAYEWDQQARLLHYSVPESFASDRYSSLLGSLVGYQENEMF
jgi:hypothetical protein